MRLPPRRGEDDSRGGKARTAAHGKPPAASARCREITDRKPSERLAGSLVQDPDGIYAFDATCRRQDESNR
jgi:hypothetical protein